ncbi:DUF1566 domain-containing protein [Pseudomonas donghuensis]|uniref:DUF1566 domain-containing protein n=1 Tax=Pseudomonas donghuensis TaxID=1163398 RepID=UPI00215FB8AF|nr:DUF1566 domain-containing protein [Pseudomonas donghuensis]UVL22414.1 DUF1566 domain-containing protein [Pseudomonas donghuensis]
MNAQAQITPPAIGEVWPGQGGIYAGIMPARGDAKPYHLILGDELGRFEWGPYGDESPATSLTDGQTNTLALLEHGDYPAAKAAVTHAADGHSDFYLPAIVELYEIWLNFGYRDGYWLWSSSQRSAYDAFYMDFVGGYQYYGDKYYALRVRPVRRLFIQ